MKKNRIMKIACVLAVAVVLSVCVVGGTFAKYVTAGSASDSAKVAKWGVTISSNGQLFSNQYKAADSNLKDKKNGGIQYTVVSSDSANRVAPGTANSDGLIISISGAPEVAVNVSIAVTASDIFLAKAEVKGLTADYHPVRFKLTNGETGANETVFLNDATMAQVKAFFEALSGNYAANTNLATGLTDENGAAITGLTGNYKLTWSWAFSTSDTNDAADTKLADYMASYDPDSPDANYGIEESFAITITITQID